MVQLIGVLAGYRPDYINLSHNQNARNARGASLRKALEFGTIGEKM
jgi:hypothetical protein